MEAAWVLPVNPEEGQGFLGLAAMQPLPLGSLERITALWGTHQTFLLRAVAAVGAIGASVVLAVPVAQQLLARLAVAAGVGSLQ